MGVVARKLEGCAAEGTPDVWMKDWVLDTPTEVERSPRFQSFQEVYTDAITMLKGNMSNIIGYRKLENGSKRFAPEYHHLLYTTFCIENSQKLSRILSQRGCRKFIIAFDECSGLHMSLIALQRIIKAADQFNYHGVTIWYLFLDTNSSVVDLAPVGPDASSYRLTEKLTPLSVWPYIGFNQMVDETHTQIQTAADVLSLGHLKVYGRPVSGSNCCCLHFPSYAVPHSTGLALKIGK